MKVSAAKFILTGQDILEIINDFVKIDDLKIDSIEIQEIITIKGSYNMKLIVPFQAKIGIGSIYGNIINLKIFSINVSKIGMLSSFKNMFLKKLLNDYADYGVELKKDTLTVNLDLIYKLIPYLNLNLRQITIVKDKLEIDAQNIVYDPNKPTEAFKKKANKSLLKNKYREKREQILNKVPNSYEDIIQYAMFIPDITILLWKLFKDKRVKSTIKIMLAGAVAYLASPIDIFPDFIPFIGQIDDVVIIFFILNCIINEIPQKIILENWEGKENIILLTKQFINNASKIIGTQNVSKLLSSVKSLFKKRG
ncbi:DUF1232 domain-containing protein [Clostridium sp. JN-1]|jgi:uncharacterized membrane protein YkvA (DUF1232 family)|uniref:YkvA family protein n=1 Tax=Clostridium sp. JN-1 TaxID=2483110 RepID=UPI000F0B3AF2|nr:DUF1232 domain-containing protein [Clostridium sp. JN-1]